MLRSKAAVYAILAVVEIARNPCVGGGLLVREIADRYGLSRAYVAKVMSHLTRAGILSSGRGPRGGFRLARSASEINFLEVVEAVGGLLAPQPALPALNGLEHVRAGMNDLFSQSTQQMREYLRISTVFDFVRRMELAAFAAPPGVQPHPAKDGFGSPASREHTVKEFTSMLTRDCGGNARDRRA